MASPICELCGSSDFVKANGMFVCQGCGTKYTAEEAKALMQGALASAAQKPHKVTEYLSPQGEPQHEHPVHGEHPHEEWHGQELHSSADFNAQLVNVNAAGPRGVNNYVCQAWQLMVEEYNALEHPDKAQHDNLSARAKECLMLLNSAALLDPANNVQCLVIFSNCTEIEKSVRDAKFWKQEEDGSWKSETIGHFDKVEIAGQGESWESKRDKYREALIQLWVQAHPDDQARKQQLQNEAATIQSQLDELKDEKRSKGLFNFKEKGEVKERMKPVKEQLAGINSQIHAIDKAASDYAASQLEAASSAYVTLDF